MEKVLQARSKPLSLKMNSIWNVSGVIIYTLSQWGMLVVIAKFGTPAMVGVFTLGLALTAPIMMMMRFNLRVAVASDSQDDYSFSEYFTSRVITTGLFLVLMFIVSLFYLSSFQTFLIILLLSLSRAIDSISDILHGRLQKEGRLDISAKSMIMKGSLSFLLFSLVLYTFNSLALATIGMFSGWLIILVFYEFKKVRNFVGVRFEWNRGIQRSIFYLTLPLGLALLVDSLVANIPRYFLEYMYGVEALGFYAAIIYIIHAGGNVIYAISNAVISPLSEDYQRRRIRSFLKTLSFLLVTLLLLGFVGVLGVFYFGEALLTILYTSEYAAYNTLFVLLTIAGIVKYMSKFVETALFATRKFNIQPYINGVGLLLIVIFSFLLIPDYGVHGAAAALIIAELLQLFVRVGILGFFLKGSKL